jgi:hypothetical protein
MNYVNLNGFHPNNFPGPDYTGLPAGITIYLINDVFP